MTIERFVVLISPIYVGLSGWFVEWCATHLPGHPHLDQTGINVALGLGAGAAAAHVLKWLHERSKHTLKANPDPFPQIAGTSVPPPDEGDKGSP